jgi:MFS family permease
MAKYWNPVRGVLPVVLFSSAVSIRTLGTGAVGAFLGIWALRLGANYFDVGLIAVAGLVTTALAGVTAGRRVDRRGEWGSIVLGSIITTAACLAFLFAPNWYFLLGAQSVRQLGFVLLSPAMLVWVSRIAPPNRRAEYLGLFSLINSGFWSLGPSAGALAYDLGGGATVFLFSAATALLSLGAVAAFQRHYRGTENAASQPPEGPTGPGGEGR